MRFLSFSLLISLAISLYSCKDDGPCEADDPDVVGSHCNDGFASNNTGPDACDAHGGLDHMICDTSEFSIGIISGTITVENLNTWATWRDSGEVQVTIFPAFVLAAPPAGAGWGEIPDGFFGPGTPGGRFPLGAPYNAQDPFVLTYTPGVTQYNYSIEVDPGTYSALAAGFRHHNISDPNLRTAPLGVYWGNPNDVSHGVVVKIPIGGGQFLTLLDEPAPTVITVEPGDELDLDFRVDFAILPLWYQ